MFGGSDNDTTELQEQILQEYDMGIRDENQIASNCDCSASYVRQTLNEYRDGGDGGGGGLL
jgi:redox-regulated HSP33 family molecular chaperone